MHTENCHLICLQTSVCLKKNTQRELDYENAETLITIYLPIHAALVKNSEAGIQQTLIAIMLLHESKGDIHIHTYMYVYIPYIYILYNHYIYFH